MGKKHAEKLVHVGFTITERHAEIIKEEAFARRYDSVSHLAREIFQAWIEKYHDIKTSN